MPTGIYTGDVEEAAAVVGILKVAGAVKLDIGNTAWLSPNISLANPTPDLPPPIP